MAGSGGKAAPASAGTRPTLRGGCARQAAGRHADAATRPLLWARLGAGRSGRSALGGGQQRVLQTVAATVEARPATRHGEPVGVALTENPLIAGQLVRVVDPHGAAAVVVAEDR